MTNAFTFYFDYTCPITYRAFEWLKLAREGGRVMHITYKTLSLREVNRHDDAPSYLDPDGPKSISILALELAKAAQAAGGTVFEQYHERVFRAMHREHTKLTPEDLVQYAREAGLDIDQFEAEQERNVWLHAVAHDHIEGRDMWQAFGVPTIIMNHDQPYYIKLREIPGSEDEAVDLYDAIFGMTRKHPYLLEIKSPLS